MHFKRFRSTSVRDGLRAVREELGPNALVLSTSMVSAPGWRGWVGCREVEIVAALERELSAARLTEPAPRHAEPTLHDDEPVVRRPSQSAGRRASRDDDTAAVAARLVAAGMDPETASEVADAIPSASRRGASLHSLRAALAARLSTLATPDDTYARVEVFVGPPGAGKTTTIAKIAAQECARGGRRLGLIAADGFRIGAVEQLRTYAEILRAPFSVARTTAELDEALMGRTRQPMLVDTAGRSPSDPAARELFRMVAARPDVRVHLVFPAGTQASAARRIFDAYAEARPSRVVLTKLDETESLSPLVGVLRDHQLPISYLGTGQRVPEDLSRATAEALAASALGDLPLPRAIHA
jgi:flagellar biosynthesis protein FlhF